MTLNFLSDALMAAAFVIISLTFITAIYRQDRLNDRIRTATILYGIGTMLVAMSMIAPHTWPNINGTIYEFALKLVSATIITAASIFGWPIIRLAVQHIRLLSPLPDTELLISERDDLAAAKTELEKEVVKRSYQLERVNRQMRLALLGSAITIYRQDKDSRYTWIFNEPAGTSEADFIGKTEDEIYPPDVALTINEIKNTAMQTHEEQSAEVRVRHSGGASWYLVQTQPDYDEHGEIIGTISCAVDITEQKRREQRQHLLMREVTHRSKNLLAVLQSIVRQTARRTRNIDEFLTRLTARLHSIAQSHDLLVNDDWSGTSLKTLLNSQLAVMSDVEPGRVRVRGKDILLTPVAVQNLGLAFHELSTNALKYGSLSIPDGGVDIEWNVLNPAGNGRDDSHLQLIWTEHHGPQVNVSEESGFGRTLLERVVGQALGGSVELDFAHEGFSCTMTLPVSRTIIGQDG